MPSFIISGFPPTSVAITAHFIYWASLRDREDKSIPVINA